MNWRPADTRKTALIVQELLSDEERIIADRNSLYYYTFTEDVRNELDIPHDASNLEVLSKLEKIGFRKGELQNVWLNESGAQSIFFAPESALRRLNMNLPEWGKQRKWRDVVQERGGRSRG